MQLSPSLAHAEARKGLQPALSYQGGSVPGWQEKARSKLREIIGFPRGPVPSMKSTTLWTRQTSVGTIEKIVFPVETGQDAVAYWCVPTGARKPYSTWICLQGHSSGMHNSINADYEDETRPIIAPGDRDFAIGCMKRGYAALCIEQRGFGYRREFDLPGRQQGTTTCHDPLVGALMIGRTLIGERVWDVDRGIDYLVHRGDVNLENLGILGNSSGGTTGMYAMALLPRLHRAIISCAFARFSDSIVARHHCCCNIVPGIMNWFEMADIVGLSAPKPVVIVNGKTDPIFPIESARSHVREVQRIYQACGTPDRVWFVEGPEGHRFYAELSWQVIETIGSD
ncbi:MAG: hypothetical protein KatS3mg104_2074 [Phycisphaerae bacterium]|jgi:dienelactone hydrolase|nr:MAG: hypothetical protein KatS3mg104_2074 [Phycisphaerae bacterium]